MAGKTRTPGKAFFSKAIMQYRRYYTSFKFGDNKLPMFSAYCYRKKVDIFCGLVPLFHTGGGESFELNYGEVSIELME